MTASTGHGWLRQWRWAALAALIALVALLSVATGRWAEQREIALKSTALRQAAETNTLGLRGIIARHDYLPYAAARHPDVAAVLAHPSSKSLVDKVNHHLAALQSTADAAALFLIDTAGTTIAASNWNSSGSFVGQSYRRRPYFEDALQGRRGLFYGLGLTTGIPGLFIAEPVRGDAGIVGVMVVKVSFETLASTWAKSIAPVVLQDTRGVVFLSSEAEWMYRAEKPLSAEDLDWLNRHGQYGERKEYAPLPWRMQALDETDEFILRAALGAKEREYLALSTAIPETGWKLTVTSDYGEIRQARREAQAIAMLLSAVLLLGVLYWRLREKRRQEQQRLRIEREQREQERQLQRSARLASVGEMASTLAHELNQPLMALSNFAVAARAMAGTAPPEMLAASLDEIVEQSQRASEIVRRVRAFINPKRGNYETLDANHVITQAIGMLQSELQRNAVAVHTTLATDLPPVRGDRVLLEQVLANLIQNAIHAQREQAPAMRRIDIDTVMHENSIAISVADRGPGIAEDGFEQLFSPFYSTKDEGLGLGLNICRTIVEAHGGHIAVCNRDGGGACFTVSLPISK